MSICHQYFAVKSEELKWQPDGSRFALELNDKGSSSTSAPKTYTNFKTSQKNRPGLSENPIQLKYPDITISRIGPGHVNYLLHVYFMSYLAIVLLEIVYGESRLVDEGYLTVDFFSLGTCGLLLVFSLLMFLHILLL